MAAELVTPDHLNELFERFTKTAYQTNEDDAVTASVQEKCEKLFAKDYRFSVVNNMNGELCSTYPSRIIFLEGEKGKVPQANSKKPDGGNNSVNEAGKYREQVLKSLVARRRTRFPVPVILFDGKHVCRSSTLACGKEIYPRMSYDVLFFDDITDEDRENKNIVDEYEAIDDSPHPIDPSEMEQDQNDVESKVGEYRTHDIQLLRDLSIINICDLMTEDGKVELDICVSSSEKADRHNRYKEFTILGMPYPGCNFFQKFRENDYCGEKMKFNWTQSYITRKLELPPDSIAALEIDWERYKEWDLNTLTQNYMKVLVQCLTEEIGMNSFTRRIKKDYGPTTRKLIKKLERVKRKTGLFPRTGVYGLLIHCISGWDRTPLFISLLRMSFWADGKIHCSLTPLEMVYLTVGYDWFLFGHKLCLRLSKEEEIMKYCFYCVEFLISLVKSEDSRKDKLDEVRKIFLQKYFAVVDVRYKSGNGSDFEGLINQYVKDVDIGTSKLPL